MDISSEMIHSLLPVFLVTTLGASALVVGLIEGAAEATALIVKVFSGALSDYWGKRKSLAVFGYSLGALSKPLFAVASTAGMVFTARFIDRIGKGIRGAPRDALVADVAPSSARRIVWAETIARHRRRIYRSAARARVDAAGQRFSRGLLGRRDSGRSRSHCLSSACANRNAKRRARLIRFGVRVCASCRARTGGSSRSAPYLHWHVSAKRSSYCAQHKAACRSRSCLW